MEKNFLLAGLINRCWSFKIGMKLFKTTPSKEENSQPFTSKNQ